MGSLRFTSCQAENAERFCKADDPVGNYIPGAIEGVASAGVSVNNLSGFFGSLRLRYFGPRALIEDDSVRSKSATLVNLKVGWQAAPWARLTLHVYNLFNTQASDIDYYYTSRPPASPPKASTTFTSARSTRAPSAPA
jgi:outer membrane receptor protein involved in Fe transport